MRRFVLLAVAFVAVFSADAQKMKKEKPATAFKTGGMLSVIVGQTGTRNWAPTGSEKFSLTAAGALNLWATKKWGYSTWETTADLAYALIKTHSQETRKIDDKIDIYSNYRYGGKKGIISFSMVGALRSQFTNGYDYTETPKKRISGFFAPAYLTLSPGIHLGSKKGDFGVHIGPDVRWVIVTNEPYSLVYQGGVKPDGTEERTLADLYGVSPGRKVRVEAGLYASAMYKKQIMKNVTWKTRVDVNSDFRGGEPTKLDVYWTNAIGMSVNKWLKVNYNFDLYHDNDVKMFGDNKNEAKTQMKSMLGVGLGIML
jgi:hypothetical protein